MENLLFMWFKLLLIIAVIAYKISECYIVLSSTPHAVCINKTIDLLVMKTYFHPFCTNNYYNYCNITTITLVIQSIMQ